MDMSLLPPCHSAFKIRYTGLSIKSLSVYTPMKKARPFRSSQKWKETMERKLNNSLTFSEKNVEGIKIRIGIMMMMMRVVR